MSPLSRGVYRARPFCWKRLARSVLLLKKEGLVQEALSSIYDTG
jgi:hypothetical protein